MITNQEHKIQEEKEEKTNWEEKVKHEFPFDWPGCLAAIQTAEEIIGTEEQRWIINWEKVYQACQVPIDAIFSSLYNKEEVGEIDQCYQQFIQGDEKALRKIHYFNNSGKNYVKLSQILVWLQNSDCKLTLLDLCGNQIGAVGAEEIAIALKSEHCKLTLLNLGYNQIGDAGAKAIADSLKSEHCKLTSLDLQENQIGAAGAKEIAITLKSGHCKLTSLDFGYNYIGTAGAKEIADALKSEHGKLTSLALWNNRIDAAGAKEIADVLKSEHCKLTSLNLGRNQIGDKGAQAIAIALKSGHCKLTSLNLLGNQIGEASKLAIALALKHPNYSRDLHIKLNYVVEEYVSKFNKEWYQAQALYTLLAHPDGNSQHLAILPPYVAIKSLFPYLFDIFKDEPQSQVGDCFFENHKNHFEMMRTQKQKPHEVKCGRQEAEKHTVYKCN